MRALSNLIQQVEPSPTLALAARAQELRAQGRKLISFTVGEPDFDTPEHVKHAAREALAKGLTKYTPVGGVPPLKEAIREKLKRDQGIDYSPAQILATNGGKQAIGAALAVLLNPGDEVIIPAPYWTSYPDMVKMFGGKPVIVPTTPESGYLMVASQLKAAISGKTKVLLLNSPSNPTGGCYSAGDLTAIAEVLQNEPRAKDVVVISDEVYEPITFDGFRHTSLASVAPALQDRIVIVNAFSKTYSMTGWRVGYAAGPKDILEAMTTHQSQFTSNICSIAQYAAAAAYGDGGAFPTMMCEAFQTRMNIVCDAVAAMPGIELPVRPRGAFYGFLRVEKLLGKKTPEGAVITSATAFSNYLLEKFDVMVVQGEAFGDGSAVRISFACDEATLRDGLQRIHRGAVSLK